MPDIRQNPTVLDDFNRANEDPLSGGGNWAQVDSGIWTPLVLANYPASPFATHQMGSESSMSYWTPTTYDGDDAEAWGFMVGGGGFALGGGVALFQTVGGVNTVTGYRLRLVGTWHLQKWTGGGSFTDLATNTPGGDDTPRYILIRRNGGDVEGWRSGFSDPTTWEMVVSATDSDYTTNLYGALWAADGSQSQLLGWQEYGAGGRTNRPQIYRWIKN